jgi:hypothetical protein
MVGLELVAVTRAADALQVFVAVWIPGIQSPDQPRWHDVIYMAPDSCLFKI